MVMLFAQISNIVLMPRIGPKVLVAAGMLLAAAGMARLTRIGVHSDYATAIVGPMLVTGAGIGLSMAPSMNTGTFGVAPYDAGVASATLNDQRPGRPAPDRPLRACLSLNGSPMCRAEAGSSVPA